MSICRQPLDSNGKFGHYRKPYTCTNTHTPDPASICSITQQHSKSLIESPVISQNPGRMCSPSCAPQSRFQFELNLSEHLKTGRKIRCSRSLKKRVIKQHSDELYVKRQTYKEKGKRKDIYSGDIKRGQSSALSVRRHFERESPNRPSVNKTSISHYLCWHGSWVLFLHSHWQRYTLRPGQIFPKAVQIDVLVI